MKGPHNRRKFVIVRHWKCPLCQRTATTPGHEVVKPCKADHPAGSPETVWMQLVEFPNPYKRKPPEPLP